jgi:SAM-dependent methyltransferase
MGGVTEMSADLVEYYQRRAPEYDAVYELPERQADLGRLRDLVPALLAGRDVLEVAAGTGYWTRFAAQSARSVCATDVNPGPLAIAAARHYPRGNVRFEPADAFGLDRLPGVFTAALVGFWWSHLRQSQTGAFLGGLVQRLEPGSVVVMMDNRYVEGSSTPIVDTDPEGNTVQRRRLSDGRTYTVIKNFPTVDDLLAAARPHARRAEVRELEYFWLLTLTT